MKTKITLENEFTGSKTTIERLVTGDLQTMLQMLEDALCGSGFFLKDVWRLWKMKSKKLITN